MISLAIPFSRLTPVAAGDGNDRAFARFDLLDVVQVLGKNFVIGGDKDRRQIGPDQGDDSMLEFRAGMPFGIEISDLFHLESALERDWKIELAPQEQHSADVGVFFGDSLDLIAEFEHVLDLAGQRFRGPQ